MPLLAKWRPADEAGRSLFTRLAATELDTVTRSRDALRGWPPGNPALRTVRIEVPGTVQAGSFSPDGRRLAVIEYRLIGESLRPRYSVCEFELPQGNLTHRYDYADDLPIHVAHLGDIIVTATWGEGSGRLDRLARGDRETVDDVPGSIHALAPHRDGFVALQTRWSQPYHPSELTGDNRVLFYDRTGRMASSVPLLDHRRYGTRATSLAEINRLAVDHASGRLAVQGGGNLILFGPDGQEVIARPRSAVYALSICLLGPGRLAVGGFGLLGLWHVTGHRLVRRARSTLPRRGDNLQHVVAVPQRGEIAVGWDLHPAEPAKHGQVRVRYFDAETLTEIDGAHGLAQSEGYCLFGSAAGSCHGLGGQGIVDVAFTTHPLESLAGRPLTEMTPSDLAAVTSALGGATRFPEARPFLELLAACLEYRFESDVAVGVDRPAGDGDDVALSADGGPP